jgi:hypothetical protein
MNFSNVGSHDPCVMVSDSYNWLAVIELLTNRLVDCHGTAYHVDPIPSNRQPDIIANIVSNQASHRWRTFV